MNTTRYAIIQQKFLATQSSVDQLWLLLCAFVIFFMQCGFLLLEVGTVRAKNARSIMTKNLCDSCFGGLAWYFVGYWVYEGTGLLDDSAKFIDFILSYAFAITTATIVSGGVASRMKFQAYMVFSMLLCGWIYPVVAKVAWAEGNWLADRGYKDFAGSGPVHTLGGGAALIGAWSLGPRFGRFTSSGKDRTIKGHSDTSVVLGALILWFGWFFFNAGSCGSASRDDLQLGIRAAMNTMVASTGSGFTAFIYCAIVLKYQQLGMIVNCILGGLVAITAGCAYVDSISALVIGIVSCVFTLGTGKVLSRIQIDDPLEVTSVHFVNGIFGVLAVGLFDRNEGLFVTGDASLLGTQLIGIGFIVAWTVGHALIYFQLFGRLVSMRVFKDDELLGLDLKYCDGYAYAYLSPEAVKQENDAKVAEQRLLEKKKNVKTKLRSWRSKSGKTSKPIVPLDAIAYTGENIPMETQKDGENRMNFRLEERRPSDQALNVTPLNPMENPHSKSATSSLEAHSLKK